MGLFRATASCSGGGGCFCIVGFGVSCFCEVAEEVHFFDTVRAVVVRRTVGDGDRGQRDRGVLLTERVGGLGSMWVCVADVGMDREAFCGKFNGVLDLDGPNITRLDKVWWVVFCHFRCWRCIRKV